MIILSSYSTHAHSHTYLPNPRQAEVLLSCLSYLLSLDGLFVLLRLLSILVFSAIYWSGITRQGVCLASCPASAPAVGTLPSALRQGSLCLIPRGFPASGIGKFEQTLKGPWHEMTCWPSLSSLESSRPSGKEHLEESGKPATQSTISQRWLWSFLSVFQV